VERILRDRNKKEIRSEMRALRRSVTPSEQHLAAISLSRNILKLQVFSGTRKIGAYLASDGEIDPLYIMIESINRGKKCYVPVLAPGQKPRIRFGSFSMRSEMCFNQFGILEPFVSQRSCVEPSKLDLILLPLVAFDLTGCRIGMGGGYYDASLAAVASRKYWHKPRLLGLAHEFQRVEKLAADEWDIPLDGIVTNRGFYEAKS